MRKWLTGIVGMALCLWVVSVQAKPIHVAIKLDKIEMIKPTEEGGDELYLSITRRRANAKPELLRVPIFPTHWLPQHLAQITNLTLCETTLEDNTQETFVIALQEQDTVSWGVDDLVGSVKLLLTYERGKLHQDWSVPQLIDQGEIQQDKPAANAQSFVLKGDGGEYRMTFRVVKQP